MLGLKRMPRTIVVRSTDIKVFKAKTSLKKFFCKNQYLSSTIVEIVAIIPEA